MPDICTLFNPRFLSKWPCQLGNTRSAQHEPLLNCTLLRDCSDCYDEKMWKGVLAPAFDLHKISFPPKNLLGAGVSAGSVVTTATGIYKHSSAQLILHNTTTTSSTDIHQSHTTVEYSTSTRQHITQSARHRNGPHPHPPCRARPRVRRRRNRLQLQ